MTNKTKTEGRRIKSVDQAFTIIDYVETEDGVTLSQIAEELDMAVSTAHIHLSTLVQNGYLIKEDGKYRCSFKFLQKGGKKRDNTPLFQIAKPELDDLQDSTGEHTNLMVEEGDRMVQLYKSQGTETIDDDAPIGKHFHRHVTAAGKAILAHQPKEVIDEYLSNEELPQYTEHTITDSKKLRDELTAIRERECSVNREEHYIGVAAVGVAIKSGEDNPIGAITVSGPSGRLDNNRIQEELVPVLQTKKNIIELRIRQRT
jgi:IclR family acetate operon transcriptional repressor